MRLKRYHGLEIAMLAVGAAAWWWIRNRPFAVTVQGSSMAPTLSEGDCLIATVATSSVHWGSLVVLRHPDRPGYEMVKRVTRVVGPDQFWVQGDNLSASNDSRSFGPVTGLAMRGLVRLRYWPPDRFALFG